MSGDECLPRSYAFPIRWSKTRLTMLFRQLPVLAIPRLNRVCQEGYLFLYAQPSHGVEYPTKAGIPTKLTEGNDLMKAIKKEVRQQGNKSNSKSPMSKPEVSDKI